MTQVEVAPRGGGPTAEERRATLLAFGGIAAVVTVAWAGGFVLAVVWVSATLLGGAPLEAPALRAFATPTAITWVGALVHVAATIPLVRWPLTEAAASRTGRIAARVGLVVALPATLVLWSRLRRRTADEAAPRESFVRLLFVPQAVASQVALWGSLALAVGALALAARFDWPRTSTLALLALWLAAFVPAIALVAIGARAVLLPVAASFPDPAPVADRPVQRFAHRWTAAAILVGTALSSVPLISGKLWLDGHRRAAIERRARTLASEVEHLAGEDSRRALGAYLAEHPDVAVRLGNRTYGSFPAEVRTHVGPVDRDGDGWPDLWIEPVAGGLLALRAPPRDAVPGLAVALGLLVLVSSLSFATVRYAQALDRDLTRAAAYVEAILADAPPPPEAHAIWSREVGVLVESISRLIDRITETNIARYVATEKTREAERIKSQFLANMSHDLRSPLNAILGFSELLLTGIDGELDEEARAMVARIHESGRHLLAQIDDILDMAKIEAGRMGLTPEPTPPATLLSRAMASLRKELGGEVDVRMQFSPGLPPVRVDGHRTVQALANVLRFALRHREGGPVDVTVRPHETDEGRFVLVRVHSTARSLSAADLRRARRGFLRLPGQPGLGLGLPLASALLELQGGRLEIEESTDGIVFTLHLPAPPMSRKLVLGETPPVGIVTSEGDPAPG